MHFEELSQICMFLNGVQYCLREFVVLCDVSVVNCKELCNFLQSLGYLDLTRVWVPFELLCQDFTKEQNLRTVVKKFSKVFTNKCEQNSMNVFAFNRVLICLLVNNILNNYPN